MRTKYVPLGAYVRKLKFISVVWSQWGAFSDCDKTCGNFAKKGRTRTCNNGVAGGKYCPGSDQDSVKCEGLPACGTYLTNL